VNWPLGCAAAIVVFALPSAGQAASDARPIDIDWQAPPECPDATSVRLYTERLLGQALAAPQRQRVAVHATVQRNRAGNWELRLSLVVDDRVAETSFVAKECRVLADATALHVALAADPVAVVESIQPPSVARPAPESNGATLGSPIESDHVSDATGAAKSITQVGLRAVSGAGFGPLPGVAPGLGIFGSIEARSFRVELGGQGFCCSEARYAALPDVGGRFQLMSGILRGCAMPGPGVPTFPVCLGVEFGFARADGFGTAVTETARSAFGAVVVGPALRVPIGRVVAVWLEGDAVISFVRPGFHVRNLETLYVAPSGGARAWAGVEVGFLR
jgi:hypothetical protein